MRIHHVAALGAAFAVLLMCRAGAADVFTLVTKDEVEAEQRFEAQPENIPGETTRSVDAPTQNPAAPPRILVISPQPGDPTLASPIRLELAFTTSPDAHILPDSFRVHYGLLRIDITRALRPYATVTDKGLVAENAAVPAGKHRLFLQISDSAGRTAVSQLQFTLSH
ncbi:MAG: hypothetical protein JWN43_2956 [Gammaproteobacteria bacterium]|nr:hypothetical protein [Gammaproteobacteria bacterium]